MKTTLNYKAFKSLVFSVLVTNLAIGSFSFTYAASAQVSIKKMNLERLRAEAFLRCQSAYQKPALTPVPVLDPPSNGGEDAIGLVYKEELAIRTSNLLDQNGFYFSPRPRLP